MHWPQAPRAAQVASAVELQQQWLAKERETAAAKRAIWFPSRSKKAAQALL